MPSPKIQITQDDYNKLRDLLQTESGSYSGDKACRDALSMELLRAEIKSSDEIEANVITLHSRVRLRDLQTKEVLELTIVLPEEADVESGRISILAPLGTAMLGYRSGDEFEWDMPGGRNRFRVEEMLFQPESVRRNPGQ